MKEYKFKINGKEYNVTVNGIEGNNASVTVNGTAYDVEMEGVPAVQAAPAPKVSTAAPAAAVEPVRGKPAASGSGTTVKSPLPGVIIDVCVKEGQTVTKGQKLAVIEAMKMENDILAQADGTVTKVSVAKGDSVQEGDPVATID